MMGDNMALASVNPSRFFLSYYKKGKIGKRQRALPLSILRYEFYLLRYYFQIYAIQKR